MGKMNISIRSVGPNVASSEATLHNILSGLQLPLLHRINSFGSAANGPYNGNLSELA